MKKKILVLCHDVIGEKVAGPGIRYQNIARILRAKNDVVLGSFSAMKRLDGENPVIKTSGDGFEKYFDKADIIFAQWLSNEMIDYANKHGKIIIFDMYAPVPIEYLASVEYSKKSRQSGTNDEFNAILKMYGSFLESGQLFVCSNDRQLDFWTGYATASGVINPESFHKLKFSLSPMGIDSKPPKNHPLLLRRSLDISKKDFVLLWTGGIWDWFDAAIIIRAMSLLKDKPIRLVFLGTKHPNNTIDEMDESTRARSLSDELGLTDKQVFFLDGWVPYEQRSAYLLDADAAIYADKESLETRFSHRTRVLDHIWAELPTICPDGDYFSEIIKQNNFGIVAKTRTAGDFASAIKTLFNNPEILKSIKNSIHKNKSQFTWEKSLSPLIDFIDNVDLDVMKKEIASSYVQSSDIKNHPEKLSIKHRIKKSAKVLLGK